MSTSTTKGGPGGGPTLGSQDLTADGKVSHNSCILVGNVVRF